MRNVILSAAVVVMTFGWSARAQVVVAQAATGKAKAASTTASAGSAWS